MTSVSAEPGIDKATFKEALSHFASGVTVVTTAHDGHRHGITVASFASVSLTPPLVLVCIDKKGRSHDAIAAAGSFAVHVLGAGQEDLSRRFASAMEDRFEGLNTRTGALGVPLLDGAVATMECKLHSQLPGGDHSIFVGEVVRAEVADAPPLVYHRRAYHQLREG